MNWKACPEDVDYEALRAPKDVWLDHYTTNVLGPIFIFQKLYPFLLKKRTRQLFSISTRAGSVIGFFPISMSAYGQSKAALNYTVKELSFELMPERFTVVAVHPGLVSTDMGQYGAHKFAEMNVQLSGVEVITLDQSASRLVNVMDNITHLDNGELLNHDGSEAVFYSMLEQSMCTWQG